MGNKKESASQQKASRILEIIIIIIIDFAYKEDLNQSLV